MKGTQARTQAKSQARGTAAPTSVAGAQTAVRTQAGGTAAPPAGTALTGVGTAVPAPAPAAEEEGGKQGPSYPTSRPFKAGDTAQQERKRMKQLLTAVGVMLGLLCVLFLYIILHQDNAPESTTTTSVATTVEIVTTTTTQKPFAVPKNGLVCMMSRTRNVELDMMAPCTSIVVIFEEELTDNGNI